MAKITRAPRRPPLPIRIARMHDKLVTAALFGVAVAVLTWLAPHALRVPTRLLLGWDVGVALYLYMTVATILPAKVESIRKRAAEQDEGAFTILALSVGTTVASLVAIAMLLADSKHAAGSVAAAQVALAATTILLSWFFMHTIFALHYAHEYYGERRDGIIGGLNFPGDKEPAYWDFLYFSLVIGMTSQVSDVAITSKVIRRMAAVHGVLSFFFNVTVLALTVNIVSNLI
jgi:uncharacterized membrane protein